METVLTKWEIENLIKSTIESLGEGEGFSETIIRKIYTKSYRFSSISNNELGSLMEKYYLP